MLMASASLAPPLAACELDGFLHGRFTPFGPAGAMQSAYNAPQQTASPAQASSTQSPAVLPETVSLAERPEERLVTRDDADDQSRSSPLP